MSTSRYMTGVQDPFRVKRGTDFRFVMQLQEDDGTVVPLTDDFRFRMQLREGYSEDVLMTFDSDDSADDDPLSLITVNIEDSELEFMIDKDFTASCPDRVLGDLVYTSEVPAVWMELVSITLVMVSSTTEVPS